MSPTGRPPRSESEIGRRTGDAREGADPLRATGRSESTVKVAAAFARNARASVPSSLHQLVSYPRYGDFGPDGELVRTRLEPDFHAARETFDRRTQSILPKKQHCADKWALWTCSSGFRSPASRRFWRPSPCNHTRAIASGASSS